MRRVGGKGGKAFWSRGLFLEPDCLHISADGKRSETTDAHGCTRTKAFEPVCIRHPVPPGKRSGLARIPWACESRSPRYHPCVSVCIRVHLWFFLPLWNVHTRMLAELCWQSGSGALILVQVSYNPATFMTQFTNQRAAASRLAPEGGQDDRGPSAIK